VIRALRIVAAGLAGIGLAGFCGAAFASSSGGERAAARITLQIAPRGLGTVSSDPPGLSSDSQPVSVCDRNRAQRSCEWGYEQGTTVVLTARPDAATQRDFAGWSTPECGSARVCRLVLSDDLTTIVALFTPLRLGVRVSDAGAALLGTDPPGAPCREGLKDPAPDLCREFPARTRVTVNASPTPGHTFRAWSPGCTPTGPASCAVDLLDEATWVGASFDDDRLPVLPTTITVQFRLEKPGDGSGRVTGQKLDCGSNCEARYDYATSLTLTAEPEAGSVFGGWNGVCAKTQVRCTFPVGPVTAIAARFDRVEPGPKPPAALRVTARTRTTIGLAWSAPTGGPSVAGYRVYVNGKARATTAGKAHTLRGLACARRYTVAVDAVDARGHRSGKTAARAWTAPCVTARVAGVRVEGSGAARAVVVRMYVSRKASVRLRLLARGRAVADARHPVRRGTSALRLRAPQRLAPGRYRLRIAVAVGSAGTLALPDRTVRLAGR
jgi:hypothetical protein